MILPTKRCNADCKTLRKTSRRTPSKTGVFLSILVLGAGTAAVTAMPASAQVLWRNRQLVSMTVNYDPDASAARNYTNLVVRARRACTMRGPIALAKPSDMRACAEDLTNRAVAQLDRPAINLAHAAATGAGRRELAGR